ncbi:hypothetical protein TNCV_1243771 [Trichonephila clavipes]|nr:hypothetical protein TNCV_1243771 [Trichonephila clavipes]
MCFVFNSSSRNFAEDNLNLKKSAAEGHLFLVKAYSEATLKEESCLDDDLLAYFRDVQSDGWKLYKITSRRLNVSRSTLQLQNQFESGNSKENLFQDVIELQPLCELKNPPSTGLKFVKAQSCRYVEFWRERCQLVLLVP